MASTFYGTISFYLLRPPRIRASKSFLPGLLVVVAGTLPACGDDDSTLPPEDGGVVEGVAPRFDPGPDPLAFGAVPWPDDLYLDADGHIAVTSLPGHAADEDYAASLGRGLAELDGFGVVSPIFFTFDGALDPSSLPADAAASVSDSASVFLLDVDPASPEPFTRIPVRINYEPNRRQLAIRPTAGHPLHESRRYAAVVTRRVLDDAGRPIVPDPDFAAVRDALTRPTDPVLAEAYDAYATVLANLETAGVNRADVAGVAVFHTQSVGHELADARAVVWSGDAPVAAGVTAVAAGPDLDERLGTPVDDLWGLDVEGGVAHGAIGWMIDGTFEGPWMISDAANVHGAIRRDSAGAIEVRRTETIPFTLLLPAAGDLSALRVVIFQHGLGDDRSQALAVADALAGAGYAVIAIDSPFHGLRNPSEPTDTLNRFTGAVGPDGFGDNTGISVVVQFAGIVDSAGDYAPFHPFYLRDALRQSAIDLFTLTRLLREGDWSQVRDADPALATLGFRDEPFGFIGYSLGGIIGSLYVGTEEEVGAAALVATGGSLMSIVAASPIFNGGYFPLLLPHFGITPSAIDYAGYPPDFFPELGIWQTLLDRGDSIAHADHIAARPLDVLMVMARHDETLNNVGTESLARAIGMPIMNGEALYADLREETPPVRDNITVAGEMVTRGLYVYDPATHGLLKARHGSQTWMHPVAPSFRRRGRGRRGQPRRRRPGPDPPLHGELARGRRRRDRLASLAGRV